MKLDANTKQSIIRFLCGVLAFLFLISSVNFNIPIAHASAIRGTTGDLWADKVLGKRDFGEIVPREVVPNKDSRPGGVVVDTSVSPGRAYIWDSTNSRIMGINLQTCYDNVLDNPSRGNSSCSADIVIGQPSGTDYGACNQDSSFSDYPNSTPASASTLCGIAESTFTVLEDKSFSSMAVDASGNLWVADVNNHRVLEYNSPFTTDTIADNVWGQTNFTNDLCNGDGGFLQFQNNTISNPTASTLCLPGAVALDSGGNLWVADVGNNRVLEFKKVGGVIDNVADVVIGQTGFTTRSAGSGLNQLNSPDSVVFDASGNLYIADLGNNRVTKYSTPLTSSMSGSVFLNQSDFYNADGFIASITADPSGNYIFSFENEGLNAYFDKWDTSGHSVLASKFSNWENAAGSIGIDALGNLLIPSHGNHEDVSRFVYNAGTNTYDFDSDFFHYTSLGTNQTSFARLEEGGWGGLGVLSNGQLLVTDGRLLFWDDAINKANGAVPDGYIGGTSPTDLTPGYSLLAVDKDDRIYVQKGANTIEIYQGPLSNSSTPIKTITGPFNLLGGGTIDINITIGGLAATSHGEYLWVSDPWGNKVFRIKNPLTTPVVDMILGQTTSSGSICNRGLVSPPGNNSTPPTLNMLCIPGGLGIDNFGNLYISDHFFEWSGNYRMLMFAKDLIQPTVDPVSVLYAPNATKEFPNSGIHGDTANHSTFEPAFDSTNRMVVGFNPYTKLRFLQYYNNPEQYNPSNPSDPAYTNPDGNLNDFYGWAFALTFDTNDNLYVYDTNRGKVMIYDQPFVSQPPVLAEVTPVSTPIMNKTPSYTFSSNKAGTISYSGSCSSSTTSAVFGNNTITFNTLAPGTYSNCKIRVTDSDLLQSNLLSVSTFTISFKPEGDFNSDAIVDLSDLSILATYWNQSTSIADANNDGIVDLSDLSILALNWLHNF